MNKFFVIFISLVSLFILFYFVGSEFEVVSKKEEKKVTLLFVGDIMLSRLIGNIIEREGVDFPFDLIKDITIAADITFGNLENPVSLQGENVGSKYSFRADPKALVGLKNAGFDVLSLANNHIYDWGGDALLDTLMHLSSIRIIGVGVGKNFDDAHRPKIIEKNGVKFAFLAYSDFAGVSISSISSSPAIASLNIEEIKNDIQKAKNEYKADCVIVSMHSGEEYQTKENERQQKFGREIINAGANFVVGHHPHVIQGVEEYNEGVIAYSLGNFIFDQNFSRDTREGLILKVTVGKNKIEKIEKIKINFTKAFQPYRATN